MSFFDFAVGYMLGDSSQPSAEEIATAKKEEEKTQLIKQIRKSKSISEKRELSLKLFGLEDEARLEEEKENKYKPLTWTQFMVIVLFIIIFTIVLWGQINASLYHSFNPITWHP